MNEVYLTPAEVSQRYGGKISPRTLSNWRSGGGAGPSFSKIGGRVLYPLSKIIAWEEKRTVSSTSEYSK